MKALDRGQTPYVATPDTTDEVGFVQVDADGVARDARSTFAGIAGAVAATVAVDDAFSSRLLSAAPGTVGQVPTVTDEDPYTIGWGTGGGVDATGVAAGKVLTADGSNGTTWDYVTDSPTQQAYYFHEFLVPNASSGYEGAVQYSASGGTIVQAVESGRVGIASLTTSTSATGRATAATGTVSMVLGDGVTTMRAAVKFPILSTSGERYQFRIGFLNTINGSDPANGAWFEYDEATSANWRICTGKNSARTKTTTSIAVGTGWTNLTLVANAAGTSIEFFIGGVSAGTITTNIPTDPANDYFGLVAVNIKSVGTTLREARVDWMEYVKTFTTAR